MEGDGERQEEGKGLRRERGVIMKEIKAVEKERGREPSCAKYLTLCANLPKVRFVLGPYGFSHAGVLFSTLPAEGILIKKGALLPPFLHPPSLKLKFPLLSFFPSLFLVHPLLY